MKNVILLTGANGFIGKNFKLCLESEYCLLTPHSYELDLTDPGIVRQYFRENNIDFIIHCANVGGARGIEDKVTTIEDNLAMVDNLLDSKNDDVKMILFGSGAMYGKTRNLHKVKESEIGEYIPKDLYGKSKLLISQKVRERDDTLMLNIFGCYGYGELESRFPTYAINQVLNNKDIIINQNVIFDYLWIEDLQNIVKNFIVKFPQNNKIINVTPTNSISLLELAEIVRSFKKEKKDIIIKNKTLNFEYTGDNEILKNEYPDLIFTTMESGLYKLYRYKKYFKDKTNE